MHIGHDPVMVANARHADILRGAEVEGAELADSVCDRDFQPRRFTGVLLVLRNLAQRTELKNFGYVGRCAYGR